MSLYKKTVIFYIVFCLIYAFIYTPDMGIKLGVLWSVWDLLMVVFIVFVMPPFIIRIYGIAVIFVFVKNISVMKKNNTLSIGKVVFLSLFSLLIIFILIKNYELFMQVMSA